MNDHHAGIEARDGVSVRREAPDAGVAHRRFGGLDVPAGLIGMLVAIALELLLFGIVGAVAGSTLTLDDVTSELTIGAIAVAVAIMFVAYLVGGWAAGRIARYDGVLNGVSVAVWAIVLTAVLAGLATWLGDRYDVLSSIGMPDWFGEGVTTAAIVGGIAALVAMFLGAALGGLVGERYNRRVDSWLGTVREGGILHRDHTLSRAR